MLGLEQLRLDHPAAPVKKELYEDGLELAAAGERAEHVGDGEEAVLFLGDDVQPLDDHVGCLLEQRGNRGDVVLGALEPAEAGAPMIVEDEVLRYHGTQAVQVVVGERA